MGSGYGQSDGGGRGPVAAGAVAYDDDGAATELLDPLLLRARTRVGTVLHGKWRLDVLLGVGGMAAVYAATHRNGTRAAVKLLHPELSTNPQVRSRFLREGYVANAVGHEGAVKVLDDDIAEDDSLFLVTELLDGETLEERRARFGGKLSEDEVLCAADQILDVLVAAHERGIVHRDLKPENLFLTRSGQLKVLDFGIARLRELSASGSNATRAGSAMGTPAYMSPEQARALWSEVDGRSDLWAVGATLFHLLSGRVVHEGRSTNEQLIAAATVPARPIASVVSGVAPTVAHLIDRALAFERDRRWPSALRMQEATRHAYHDRFGAPLSTAPRLTVPESVPNKTIAGTNVPVSPRQGTTAQPLFRSAPAATGPAPVHPAVVVGGGLLGFAALAALTWVAVARTATLGVGTGASVAAESALPSASALATSSSPPPAPSPPPSAAAPSPLTPPTVAATDLPIVGAATEAGAPTASSAVVPPVPAAPPTAAAPAPKSRCSPPFTIDPATGKKVFKVECL